METFVITGLVREKESGVGLPGLIVRAYDKDAIYDDLMGEARTGGDGGFCITSEAKDFRDFLDVRPDVYLRVLCPAPAGAAPREIFNTRHGIRWNARHLEYFVVEIPHAIACELPCDEASGHDHQGGHDHGAGHGHGEPPSPQGCCHEHHKPSVCTPITRCRDIYLKIEKLPAYSPVAPDDAEHDRYRRDCMRNPTIKTPSLPKRRPADGRRAGADGSGALFTVNRACLR